MISTIRNCNVCWCGKIEIVANVAIRNYNVCWCGNTWWFHISFDNLRTGDQNFRQCRASFSFLQQSCSQRWHFVAAYTADTASCSCCCCCCWSAEPPSPTLTQIPNPTQSKNPLFSPIRCLFLGHDCVWLGTAPGADMRCLTGADILVPNWGSLSKCFPTSSRYKNYVPFQLDPKTSKIAQITLAPGIWACIIQSWYISWVGIKYAPLKLSCRLLATRPRYLCPSHHY